MSAPATIPVPTSTERHRYHLLDGLRGVAALQVALLHTPLSLRGGRPFANGYLAVDFFFCLSGFVIAFSYEDRLRKAMRVRDFVVARIIRLFPLYLLGSFLAAAQALTIGHLMQHGVTGPQFSALWIFAVLLVPNLFISSAGSLIYPFDIPAWSLLFEMVANVLYGLLLARRFASSKVLIAIACVSFTALASIAFHTGSLDFGYLAGSWPVGFARVGFSFFVGVLLYRFTQAHPPSIIRQRASLVVSACVTALLVAALTIDTSIATTGGYRLCIVGILFPALVYVGSRCKLPVTVSLICGFLGDMSYPLYVLHSPLLLPLLGGRQQGFSIIIPRWGPHFSLYTSLC